MPAILSLSTGLLNAYKGRHIKRVCPTGFHSDHVNHCAHFVSHVLQLRCGTTCTYNNKNRKELKGQEAGIRVNELFMECDEVNEWTDAGKLPHQSGLIYITRPANIAIAQGWMGDNPTKHVGIYFGSRVWHYSNSHHMVVEVSLKQFQHHYHGKVTVAVSTFPDGAQAVLPAVPNAP